MCPHYLCPQPLGCEFWATREGVMSVAQRLTNMDREKPGYAPRTLTHTRMEMTELS